MTDDDVAQIDPGDKAAVSLAYKKNLGNYESMDFYASVSITKRGDESDVDFYRRAWTIVEDQLDGKVEEAEQHIKQGKK